MAKKRRLAMDWYSMDIHIHTAASSDYQQPGTSYLDVLHRAEARGLDIIAFTDHNTVAGYRRMQEEIQQLEMLAKLKRIMPEEQLRLDEYRRLLSNMLVLPGFEFTATFGFHIIGLFSPKKPLREIEHLLLDLNIPSDQLDDGSATVGATSDVLTAYRLIAEGDGLVIAAHANSSNGVAMRGFSFGGQTKIAYTQDANLHALEVTDLDQKGRHATAAFFSGTKPEYPRRMHCIQGSDAHRLTTDPVRKKNLGIGDRATDVLLPETTFEALKELFSSNDFARTRPHHFAAEPAYDFIRAAQEEGANIIQDFHESATVRGGKRYAVLADICAFANTNGGTLYLGLSADPKKPVAGIAEAEQVITQLEKEISDRIRPPLAVTLDQHEVGGKKIVRLLIPRGDEPPYVVDDYKIYVRSEAETELAVRDEVVGLVLRSTSRQALQPEPEVQPASRSKDVPGEQPEPRETDQNAPRTGVEVVAVEERGGGRYYTLRDLRNGDIVKNVTQSSARRLWHYAISRHMHIPADFSGAGVQWKGDLGLIRRQKQGQGNRYDLVQRSETGYRFYYGVTDDGIDGAWKSLVGQVDD